MSFYREQMQPLRRSAWVLELPMSTLADWNKLFNKDMSMIELPEKRGKKSKVTPELVRQVVEKARKKKDQGKRIRLKQFTLELANEGMILSSKTVSEILIANGLREPSTRKRRPRFYQSLRRRIPNGLLGFDGGEFTVCIDGKVIKLNLELGVDVGTFTHTAFSIRNTETASGVLEVLQKHVDEWGSPLGIVCDHGSANMSADVAAIINSLGIEFVPAGPGNPKGNGTLEGAFSQMKSVVGTISLDTSSHENLAKSVLEAIVSVYVKMRNKLPLRRKHETPLEIFSKPVNSDLIEFERQRLKQHKESKNRNSDDNSKIERIHFLIQNKKIPCDPDARKRAEKTIIWYTTEAITKAEKAFIKAVDRKPERLSLPYFFGILKKLQQEQDDDSFKDYCRQRYNYQQMLDLERRLQPVEEKPPTVEGILKMLETAINSSIRSARRVCLNLAREMTEKMAEGKRYLEPLKKKFVEAIGKLRHLDIGQKEKMLDHIQQFINLGEDRVT